ncbi:MAG: GNAT family N-acetyltransferase [Anaerolineaceae bacterium]|nr:GNAT family N-acetyltransferase [Anaerolineaceae bacterium]
MIKVTAYRDTSAFDELHDEWDDLLTRSHTNTIFSTWEWHKHWWEAYHPGDLWVLALRAGDDSLVGIASMFIEHSDEGRNVRFVGCEDVTDYLDFVIDKDCMGPVYDALVTYLIENASSYDRLLLCNIPETSPTLDQFNRILQDQSFTTVINQQDVCPVIQLPTAFEDYVSALDKKERHEVRRKLRRAEGQRQMGALDWYIVDQTHEIDEEIAKFLKLMAASHPEKAQFLTDSQHVTFFKSMIPAAMERGWLQLTFLVANDTPIATYLNFDYNDHILVYNSGLDPEGYGHLSPGIVLLAYCIEHAIDLGREVFDFLRGDEQYKYRMGGKDTAVKQIIAELQN